MACRTVGRDRPSRPASSISLPSRLPGVSSPCSVAASRNRHHEVGSLIITDVDTARAHQLADRLGATAAPGVDEIFTWGVDAVVITAATAAHAELIGRAARSGLPVFCEKPIAVDLP